MVLHREVQYQQVTYVRLEAEVENLCQTFKCLDKILLYIYIYTPIYIYLYMYTLYVYIVPQDIQHNLLKIKLADS